MANAITRTGTATTMPLEVTVSGPVDPATGMVCNLVDLDGLVEREVLSRYDLSNLNTLQEFAHVVPTTENLSYADLRNIAARLSQAHLERVRLEETMMNSFEYAGGMNRGTNFSRSEFCREGTRQLYETNFARTIERSTNPYQCHV